MLSFSLFVCDRRGKEWDDVDQAEKERIGLKTIEDGEFWCVADTNASYETEQPLTNNTISDLNDVLH